eukprot:2893204-Pleurochrysis_carterae.AAC.1
MLSAQRRGPEQEDIDVADAHADGDLEVVVHAVNSACNLITRLRSCLGCMHVFGPYACTLAAHCAGAQRGTEGTDTRLLRSYGLNDSRSARVSRSSSPRASHLARERSRAEPLAPQTYRNASAHAAAASAAPRRPSALPARSATCGGGSFSASASPERARETAGDEWQAARANGSALTGNPLIGGACEAAESGSERWPVPRPPSVRDG